MKKRIVIEFVGPDGCGKTTQMNILSKKLQERLIPVVTNTFDSKPITKSIVSIYKKYGKLTPIWWVSLLSLNDRLLSLPETGIVLFDKYRFFNYTYIRMFELPKLIATLFYPTSRTPDVYILLDVSPEETFRRKNGFVWGTECGIQLKGTKYAAESRGKTSFERFQNDLLDEMKQLITKEKNYIIIDASKEIDAIATEVWEYYNSYLQDS